MCEFVDLFVTVTWRTSEKPLSSFSPLLQHLASKDSTTDRQPLSAMKVYKEPRPLNGHDCVDKVVAVVSREVVDRGQHNSQTYWCPTLTSYRELVLRSMCTVKNIVYVFLNFTLENH